MLLFLGSVPRARRPVGTLSLAFISFSFPSEQNKKPYRMIVYVLTAVVLLAIYLWHCDRAVTTTHPEAAKLAQKPWSTEEIRETYRRLQASSIDVKPYLCPKQSRRYVVTGGSGLVGGWIVHHLLMRGENPQAIRILDITPTKRPEAAEIPYVKTDVTDSESIKAAFTQSWPNEVKDLPLTVFHCVAYIRVTSRKADFLPFFTKINTKGTQNVLEAAQSVGASVFISTSSGSIAEKAPSFFPWPWQRWPRDIFQFMPNAEPLSLDLPLSKWTSCYAYSKALAEDLVLKANTPNLRTGTIRPAHAVYGHGVDNSSSLSWDYLRRGGAPSWIWSCVGNFVNAQNVSIAHLCYENALLNKGHAGGKGCCATDPNPPITFRHLYNTLQTLAHPLTPVKFTKTPHVTILLFAYCVEAYELMRVRYLNFLPAVQGDLAMIQPTMFQTACLHLVATDTKAREEIGYKAPISTRDGLAWAVLDWNEKVEANSKRKLEQGKGGEVYVQQGSSMPVVVGSGYIEAQAMKIMC